jgi:hypothetical protein
MKLSSNGGGFHLAAEDVTAKSPVGFSVKETEESGA